MAYDQNSNSNSGELDHCLVIGPSQSATDLFVALVEKDFQLHALRAPNCTKAIATLKKSCENLALIILVLPDAGVAEFFKEARNLPRQIPVLLTSDENNLGECTKFINYHPQFAKISFNLPLNIIKSSIKRLLRVINRKDKKAEPFCAIEGKLFLNLGQAPNDLYLKIGDGKMLKVFNRGTKINKEDIEKYELKNHPFFFLQAPDYEKAMVHILTQLEKNIKETPPTGSDKLGPIAQFASTKARQLIRTLGLSDTSFAMAGATVNTISKMAMDNPKISTNFKKFIKGKNYLSDHSLAIPFVAAAVMEHFSEFGPKEFEKLSYAAFFTTSFWIMKNWPW